MSLYNAPVTSYDIACLSLRSLFVAHLNFHRILNSFSRPHTQAIIHRHPSPFQEVSLIGRLTQILGGVTLFQ